jgi:uncharacterized RDD family membrane protein YckC
MDRQAEVIRIETPEHFLLEFRRAGIGTRSLAYTIDRLIQITFIAIVFISIQLILFVTGKLASVTDFFFVKKSDSAMWLAAVGLLIYGIISIGYFILFEYFWSGSTPGKKTQSIRVMRNDGRPITFLDSLIRNILRFIDIIGDFYPLGLLVMFLDPKGRRFGDMAAGTVVVAAEKFQKPADVRPENAQFELNPEIKKIALLLESADYSLLNKYVLRRSDLDPEYRSSLAASILFNLSAKTAVSISLHDPDKTLALIHAAYLQNKRVF